MKFRSLNHYAFRTLSVPDFGTNLRFKIRSRHRIKTLKNVKNPVNPVHNSIIRYMIQVHDSWATRSTEFRSEERLVI